MAKEVKVPLSEPIQGHDELIREIVLREPSAMDYYSLGDPHLYARNPDGSIVSLESGETIKAYLDRCIVSPNPILAGQIGLADAMAVKAALLSFFETAQATSTKPATSSSST